MKCADCGQDILQVRPEMCPYCRSKNLIDEENLTQQVEEAEAMAKAGRYEEAALRMEKLDLWTKARSIRIEAKKKGASPAVLEEGKVKSIMLTCPHCGEAQAAKSEEETCNHCGTTYLVPKVVFELGLEKTD